MPNGITSDIYEGKDVTLRDYLMRVGRSMSMAIMQRDSDPDQPVRRREESTYERKRVAELTARLEELRGMSAAKVNEEAEREFCEAHAAWEKAKEEKTALRARYESMIAEVEAWEPEEKVAYVKEHAIKYLRESIDFDCGRDGEDMRYYPEPVRLSGPDWLQKQLTDTEDSLKRAEKHLEEEIARVADFNEHIDAFLRCLPPEKVPA